MPYQPINFANIEPQGNPFMRNFAQTLMQGYQAGQMPFQMQRQQQQEELANAFQRMKMEQEPQRFENEQQGQQLLNKSRGYDIQKQEQELDPNAFRNAIQRKVDYINSDPNMPQPTKDQLIRAITRGAIGAPQQTPEEINADKIAAEGRKNQYDLALGEKKYNQNLNLLDKKNANKPMKSGETPTTSTLTATQGIIQAVNNVRPLIKELTDFDKKNNKYTFEVPNQNYLNFFNPDQQAKYQAITATITESLMSALNLPKTNESLETVKHIVERRWNESDKAYRNRLTKLDEDLVSREQRARKLLKDTKLSEVNSNEGDTFNLEAGDWL